LVSSVFKRDVKEATGIAWEEWTAKLDGSVDVCRSHDQLKHHLRESFRLSEEWAEWLAVMYGQRLGRIPVGVTKDAGVQIGVRRTIPGDPEWLWHFLLSPQGLSLWIGNDAAFTAEKGFTFRSRNGVTGKLTVVQPFKKLRMTWQRLEWEKASRLQITLLPAKNGKTTVAIHQEMLEDVYIRELMRRHWSETLHRIEAACRQRDIVHADQ